MFIRDLNAPKAVHLLFVGVPSFVRRIRGHVELEMTRQELDELRKSAALFAELKCSQI